MLFKYRVIKNYLPTFWKSFEQRKQDITPERKLNTLYAGLLGDIIGSQYEGNAAHTHSFDQGLTSDYSQFTDDSVLTIATLDCLVNHQSYQKGYYNWARKYPMAGYGSKFLTWFNQDAHQLKPYNSCGNGSAMRVSPIALFYDDIRDVALAAYQSAIVTHNHPEGVKGAIVTAVTLYLALYGSRDDVYAYLCEQYNKDSHTYPFHLSFDDMKRRYYEIQHLNKPMDTNPLLAQTAVPFAIRAAYDAMSYEQFIKLICYVGRDADTECIIGGGIAYALNHQIHMNLEMLIKRYLDHDMLYVITEWKSMLF